MDVVTFDNWFARELPELHVEWQPDAVPAPTVVVLNEPLAAELGFDVSFLSSPEGTAALAGNGTLPGSIPTAMAYAGHQFGSFSGRLGDGRALLIGEVTDRHGVRRDIHLKGSGRTPFARGGDGKATLGPMLREYLMAEAMHALGIPTGRALSVVATGEQVRREQFEPGAVLARVALSHIRVGTFEYAARVDGDVLRRLADHAIERHHPAAADAGDGRYLALLDAVVEVQAALVARWMLVGFIHGVMNTDNVTISGETIDYGPCAFMERHDPATVYSSIDHGGRYAYGNQPGITQWNLARLAETLLPLIDDDPNAAVAAATDVLDAFTDRYQRHWLAGMRTKLGLEEERPGDDALAADLVGLLHLQRIDHTAAFRALAADLRGDEEAVASLGENRTGLDDWRRSWRDRLAEEGRDAAVVASAMDGVNPIYIPRNHLVHEALEAAVAGDHAPFHELLGIVTRPFEERPGLDRFASPAPDSFNDGFQTFCGT